MRLTIHHAHSFSALDKHLEAERDRLFALNGDASAVEDDLGVGDEEESPELLSLDPKEWKVFLVFYDEMIYAQSFLETGPLRCPWSFSPAIQSFT